MGKRATLFIDQSILQEGNYSAIGRTPDPPNRYAAHAAPDPLVMPDEGGIQT